MLVGHSLVSASRRRQDFVATCLLLAACWSLLVPGGALVQPAPWATPLPDKDDSGFHYQQSTASPVQAVEATAAAAAAGFKISYLFSSILATPGVPPWLNIGHSPQVRVSPTHNHSSRALKQQQMQGHNCQTLTGRNAMYKNGYLCRAQMTWASPNCTKYITCPIVRVQEPYNAACQQLGFKTFMKGCYMPDVSQRTEDQCWNGLSWEYGTSWVELTCCS